MLQCLVPRQSSGGVLVGGGLNPTEFVTVCTYIRMRCVCMYVRVQVRMFVFTYRCVLHLSAT